MFRFLKLPLVRISFGLSILTVGILLMGELLGLLPDTRIAELESRKTIAETLSVQLSMALAEQDMSEAEEVLRMLVDRNRQVLSGAVRQANGTLVSAFGSHEQYWTLLPDSQSTATQVRVPLYDREGRWGAVELSFAELPERFALDGSLIAIILFMALASFIAYMMFLKRSLRELNPDGVIPDRVRTALDTLSEGLLIIDEKGFIVFSNQSFARKTATTPEQLVGKETNCFDWLVENDDSQTLPWLRALQGEDIMKGIRVKLTTHQSSYTFAVNVSPITASGETTRGALITFDDITEIESKNEALRRAISKLRKSQSEISRQNKELQVLANRDALTGMLNRRALFEGFDSLFSEAREESWPLSCIMVDIDHFKSVNDNHGHPVGDQVIKFLSQVLSEHSRPQDLVGRLGGEEFCVVLPGASAGDAMAIGERMRKEVAAFIGKGTEPVLRITSSFGVAALSDSMQNHEQLLECADKALYQAKETGRNRVVAWEAMQGDKVVPLEAEDGRSAEVDGAQAGLGASSAKVVELFPQHGDTNSSSATLGTPTLAHPDQAGSILLNDRIEQAIHRVDRYGGYIALMVLDVEALQRVSDTLGQAANQKLSKSVVSRLKQALRSTDSTILVEEDELLFSVFPLDRCQILVLLTDLKQSDSVSVILQRLFRLNDDPVVVEGDELFLNFSAGVSMFPGDGDDPDTLIRNASSALGQARQRMGRNNFQFYAEAINQHSRKLIQLEAELYHALERDELLVYYQPITDLKTGRITSMEALIRWQHPQLGLVPPNDFIPLAEQTGLIDKISLWVIESVCQQIRHWQETGYGHLTVAVNISPVELRNPELPEQIITLVESYSLSPERISFEITETIVMQDLDLAIRSLEKLKQAGFGISVDDFGTGYSSLSYLKQFPLTKVKIDRSFISGFTKGPTDAAIVSAIIAMSHSMDLRVVAEGVETEEQLRFLQDLQCDEMQGYLISKPLPSDEANAFLAQSFMVQRLIRNNAQAHHKA